MVMQGVLERQAIYMEGNKLRKMKRSKERKKWKDFFVVYLMMMSVSILYSLDVWIIRRERERVIKGIKDEKKRRKQYVAFPQSTGRLGRKIRHLSSPIFLEKQK
jgi:hypothetical protein